MPDTSTGDLLTVCPECSSSKVKARLHKEPTYHCYECGAEFENPDTRTRQGGRSGGPIIECVECGESFETRSEQKRVPCPKCGCSTLVAEGRIAYLGRNELVQRLAERPRTTDEVTVGNLPIEVRDMTYRLSVPESERQTNDVLYLEGDEREAVRVFIEKNGAFVEEDWGAYSVLKRWWPEEAYTTLLEQYYWMGVNGDGN